MEEEELTIVQIPNQFHRMEGDVLCLITLTSNISFYLSAFPQLAGKNYYEVLDYINENPSEGFGRWDDAVAVTPV
jgi:hypothetical protein